MKITPADGMPDVLILAPDAYEDERGARYEGHRVSDLSEAAGYPINFVVSNVAENKPFAWRGLHYQIMEPQGKLIRCLKGELFDICVDLRKSSPTFGQVYRYMFKPGDRNAVWIPPGFAHGFLAGPDGAVVHYDLTTYYREEWARVLNYYDPALGITLPKCPEPIKITMKDERAPLLAECDVFP